MMFAVYAGLAAAGQLVPVDSGPKASSLEEAFELAMNTLFTTVMTYLGRAGTDPDTGQPTFTEEEPPHT